MDNSQPMTTLPKNNSRIDSELLDLYQEFMDNSNNGIGAVARNQNSAQTNENGTSVIVRITSGNVDGLLPALENLGFEVLGSRPDLNFVEGSIPIAAINQLESLETQGLLGVISIPSPQTDVGAVTSQADFVHEADRVRAALPTGYDGTGVRIGVMSDSYDVSGNGSAAADIASGDLPAGGVTVLQEGPAGSSDEGRAMAQLIHDLAPGSSLAFSSVFSGQANFAQQIRDLADPSNGNADILVDDVVYLAEPFFQDGVIAQAVDEVVTNNGVAYFSSAGNRATRAYESEQFQGATDSAGLFTGTFHDFDPGAGVDTRQLITVPNGRISLSLQWDDPFFTTTGVDTNLDIFLVTPGTDTILAQSNNNNTASQSPVEILTYTNSGAASQAEVMIGLANGPEPGRIKYVNFGRAVTFDENFPGNNAPAVNPHTAAVNGKAVAAVPFFDQENPESFTSVGPSTILFDPQGNRLPAPEVRQTPDLAAIDGTDTTFFGQNLFNIDANTFPNFFGTSAAAPHAAAVAALVLQANPSFTPAEIYQRLEDTAQDIGAPGRDNVTGEGLINAYDAVFGSVVPASVPFTEDFEDGDLPIAFETRTNGAGRIQVTTDNNPQGTRQITLDSSGILRDSLNELILHVDAANFANFTTLDLSFDQKEFFDEDQIMPATFTGSSNSDGVALSVDGTNWFRLFDLTGANSTTTFQTKSIDLIQFASDNNITLTSDTQIKFQQFDNFFISSNPNGSDGFAFDNISIECFLTGTHILTDKGEITVENLEIGDKVVTAEGKIETVKWIGYQTVKPEQVKQPLRGYPILIKAGALGNNLPHRDLYVSPDHAMYFEGVLINAGALVNGTSIVKTEPTEAFTYYHVELENHALLLAEGAHAESYLPQNEERLAYENGAEYEELYPHGSNLMLWPMDYPRISSWNKVPRYMRKKLNAIAAQLGFVVKAA